MLIVTKIDEILTIKDKDNGEIYKVKPIEDNGNGCTICIFNNKEICLHIACCNADRPDRKRVHFEYIEL